MTEDTAITPPASAAAPSGRGARLGAIVIALLIVASLAMYFIGDRLTPSTSQARIQSFVVPVASEVAGKVMAVHVRNNDEVRPGQPLFDIQPEPYRIALARARADLESVRSSIKGSVAGVDAARASLAAARANRDMAERDAGRLEKLYQEDAGAISVRRLETSQATREEARSKVHKAQADLRKAQLEVEKGPVLSELDRLKNEARAELSRQHVESLLESNGLRCSPSSSGRSRSSPT